jgi:hypothetical protein
MELDKGALNELERNISPPMRAAITLPVSGTNVTVYVCSSRFSPPTDDAVIRAVAERLTIAEAGK